VLWIYSAPPPPYSFDTSFSKKNPEFFRENREEKFVFYNGTPGILLCFWITLLIIILHMRKERHQNFVLSKICKTEG